MNEAQRLFLILPLAGVVFDGTEKYAKRLE